MGDNPVIMAKNIGQQTSFAGGISFNEKEGSANSYAFGINIDHRTDPKAITLNPRTELDSGSVVTDLPMWGARACTRTFSYDNSGSIYQKTTGSWSKVHTAASSQGNGLAYFTADSALYYAQNTTFGRLLDACTASTFYDNFLGSEGGEPTNTKSIDLEASSSMYASRADTASTSITSDLTLEAYIKPESLPTTGNTMTLISKWDENTNLRSYKMDIATVSNFFGSGTDGVLTISSNTTEAPIDSACTGTTGTYALTATNASFAADQKIMIHQTQGTGAGTVQFTSIQSYTAGTITTKDLLTATFTTGAQVRVLKQYTNVTINSGITYTAKAWNGTVGGILAFYSNGTVTVAGTITASAKGFRGGTGGVIAGTQGEGTPGVGGSTNIANGNGGGAGIDFQNTSPSGGGHANAGSNAVGSTGGTSAGSATLSTMVFGGGGGGASASGGAGVNGGDGGDGGGIIIISGKTIVEPNSITSNGENGALSSNSEFGGGAGAGGSILINCQTVILGTSKITATGGTGANGTYPTGPAYGNGADGSVGRIAVYYSTSYTGTTSPSASINLDSTLGATDGYSIRLVISNNGTATESYIQEVTDLTTGVWARYQVSWENSSSTANFYKNGVLLGTKTGAFTAISDNASVFTIGADFNTTAQNFYDGLMDDVRVWNDVRTASELLNYNDQVLAGTEANLVAYYQFTSSVVDSQTSALNSLTAYNSPTYSSDVPFSGITTRNDQDQGLTSGSFVQGYTLATAINEGATHRQTFVPTKDPQKSITIDVDTVGTGNWTLTVHDSLNREVASKTVTAAELTVGFYEFIFASVWRPIIGATYHFHVTSTVADGIVDTVTTVDLETAYFTTHYQFLVSDAYHPISEMLDFMVIGNERYLAKFQAGDSYEPHQLTFPSGYRVRCLAYWREFMAIGCWKGTDIDDFDDGRIFFWDGISDTYNHSIPVPEGGVNSMFGTQDVLFIVAGYTGEILIYTGGGSATKFNKIPKLQTGEYIEIAPGSMNMWRSKIHMGVNLNTDSESVYKGVYSIGSANSAYPASLGLDYSSSLGQQTNSNVKIGMIFPSGQNLYIGWENSNAYGIDSINPTNDVFSSGSVELLISDMGQISKQKYPLIARIDFEPLASGESVRVKYKADRETNYNAGSYEDTTDAKETKLRISERVKEIQVAVDLTTTVATSPKLLGVSIVSEFEESSAQNE